MPLGMEVGLDPDHIVQDGDPAPPKRGVHSPTPRGGHSPRPIFGPCLLWPNGWMDQDATWYEHMPRPRRHCVRWRSSSPPPQKNRGHSLPQFSAHVCCGQTWVSEWVSSFLTAHQHILGYLVPNGCMDQDATWYGGRPRPKRLCVHPSPKRGHTPNFRPMFTVAKRLDGSTW